MISLLDSAIQLLNNWGQVSNAVYRNRWKSYISKRGNLKPDVLLKRFKQLIEEAIDKRKRSSRDELDEYVNIQLRKIPITIKVTWRGMARSTRTLK